MESIESVRVRQIGVRVNTQEYAILEGMAKRLGRSMSQVVRMLFLHAADTPENRLYDAWREIDESPGALPASAAGGVSEVDKRPS